MNTSNIDLLKKLVDDLPETKAGQAIEYLLFLKMREETELNISEKEEKEIWERISSEEKLNAQEVKMLLLRDK